MKTRLSLAIIILLTVLNGCIEDICIRPTPPAPLPVALSGLQPAEVFGFFEEVCAIPRESGNTKAISDYVVKFAHAHRLKCIQDQANNVVVYAPATKGYEQRPSIAIQAHLDMVCASTGPDRDPAKVGVKPQTDGEYVWALEASLGADNGIGIAQVLALLTNLETLPHPALEVVFTADE